MEQVFIGFGCLSSTTHTCTEKPWESSLSDGRLDHLEQLVPYKMVNCSHFLPAKQNSWTTKGNNSKWVGFPWAYSWSEISTFCSGGFDKGVESSKSNLSNLQCESQNKLLTYFWHNKPAGTGWTMLLVLLRRWRCCWSWVMLTRFAETAWSTLNLDLQSSLGPFNLNESLPARWDRKGDTSAI